METNFKVDMPSFALGFNTGKSKGGSGGGAELNIHYGMEPPEDTSNLWVKSGEADKVEIRENTLMPIIDETLPMPRYAMGQAVIGNKMYLIGGMGTEKESNGGSMNGMQKTIFCFDMENKTFEKLPVTLPVFACESSCGVVGTDIYIFGGWGCENKTQGGYGLKTIYRFDTVQMTITKESATFTSAIMGAGVGVIGAKIYLFGGATYRGSNNTKKYAYCFDTDTKELKTLANLSDGRTHIGVVVHNDVLYLLGGFNSYGRNTVQIYDPETNSYTTGKSLPKSYGNGNGYAKIGSTLYMPRGYYPGGTANLLQQMTNELIVFDIETLTGFVANYIFPYKYNYSNCGCLDGNIYMLGGNAENENATYGYAITDAIVKIPTELPLEKNTLWLRHSSGYPNATIICGKSVSVGVLVTEAYLGNSEGSGEPVETAVYKNGEWQTI